MDPALVAQLLASWNEPTRVREKFDDPPSAWLSGDFFGSDRKKIEDYIFLQKKTNADKHILFNKIWVRLPDDYTSGCILEEMNIVNLLPTIASNLDLVDADSTNKLLDWQQVRMGVPPSRMKDPKAREKILSESIKHFVERV